MINKAGLVTVLIVSTLLTPDAHARRKKNAISDAVTHAWSVATVQAPENEETCFSPDEPCDLKLLKMIQSAQISVDVAIYDINIGALVDELLAKSKKMPVRIVVDKKQAKGSHSRVNTLVRGGAQVRFGTQRGIMHNKFTIVDGRIVELGSFNYTHHAHEANNENQVYLTSPKVVHRYQARFDTIWKKAKPIPLSGVD